MVPIKKALKTLAILLFWLLVWQVSAVIVNQEILIPTPAAALAALKTFAVTGKFWLAVLYSMLRILAGFTAGIAVGATGAVLSSRFGVFRAVTYPLLQLIKAVPVASFIILALVWFRSGILPAIISFTTVLPIIWGSTETAISNVDKELLEMARVYRLGGLKTFAFIKVPSVFPAFFSSCLTALGFAWKSGVAAEVICRPNASLGDMLQSSKVYLETPSVFALTAVVAGLSLLLELVIRHAAGRYINDKY